MNRVSDPAETRALELGPPRLIDALGADTGYDTPERHLSIRTTAAIVNALA
jgi:hypothetical protein